jgi:hypothetical protein
MSRSNVENGPAAVRDDWLAWLADAPMFIDGPQVSAFYDAVLRPRYKTIQLELARERGEQFEKSGGGKLGVNLPTWFPWLKFDAEAHGDVAKTDSETEGETITLEPIENPSRQLVELCLHYLLSQPERIWFQEGTKLQLPSTQQIRAYPRMLAAIDFPPETMFLPTAAELNDGRVVTFRDRLIDRFKKDGGTIPVVYPDDTTTSDGSLRRDSYWRWFRDHWSDKRVNQVIEDTIGSGGRPRWLDYKVLYESGQVLHLQMVGHGEVDTGVFAYNLVRRGWDYGIGMVGRLKVGPDVNVLAIYEN